MSLRTELFDYELPARLIAQTPAASRDQSRLLVVDRAAHTVAHHVFADLPHFLRAGDTLFRNNAAVLPARLHAFRPSGGAIECLLLRPEPARPLDKLGAGGGEAWWCLVRPAKKLPVGATFAHPDGDFQGKIIEKQSDGGALVCFTTRTGEPITAVANRLGEVPLPPYIGRHGTPDERASDLERYQTVYADRTRQVAVAAPTAGLHFTPMLLAALAAQGVHTADLVLHVGLGTFRPIATDTVEAHAIHREIYELPAAAQRALFPPRTGRRIAVGTTSVRAIEDFLATHTAPPAPGPPNGLDQAHIAEASLFIRPPRTFRGVDALITNFHQPRSTLLCLVAAFLAPGSTDGIAWLKEIYADAIAREYRFFSYGDAMLIL
ncbi:MAG TPA: tRNA preQ1(34) S-adenosylmethionine ribosyltransferase-isomerase QueA [Opitutaceae bacterium]|nr:tRNA preQ1(34) S-adenosylmethionine ribosyltransferase-isomerase QueA [Opitutaceae bacterium]